jgi:hypothetical protein
LFAVQKSEEEKIKHMKSSTITNFINDFKSIVAFGVFAKLAQSAP